MGGKRKGKKIAATIVLFLMVVGALAAGVRYGKLELPGGYASGWEVYSTVASLRASDKFYPQQAQFTSPNYQGPHNWRVDVDEPDYQVPTIEVTQSDVRHTNMLGQWTPDSQYIETRKVERGGHVYYLDYHVFTMDVTLRTMADVVYIGWAPITGNHYKSETAYNDYEGMNGLPFQGGTLVSFTVNPWKGGTYRDAPEVPVNAPPGSKYVLNEMFVGVMQTYVVGVSKGTVEGSPNTDSDVPSYVKPGLAQGSVADMYTSVAGMEAEQIAWGAASPDSRIASSVYIYLPVDMLAGAHVTRNWLGQIDKVQASDVFVKYTVRVDVLATHDFVLQTGTKPPPQENPEDWVAKLTGFWDNVLGGLNPFSFLGPFAGLAFTIFFMIAVIAVVIIVLKMLARRLG